ncbi:GntR family transcriptional regulator [Streptomyces syringium]|uniref:GntR family transcriptional regulator n=1 Tax=Streptomyces syringium TaxID=76729 RepID=UPI003402E71A
MEQGRPRTAAPLPSAGVPAQAGPARGEHVHDEREHGYGHPVPDARRDTGRPERTERTEEPARGERPARRMPQRYSVRGQVLDALRKALVSGELIPGEVYSGPALGERFGVSATPVREAMQQLVLEGAVEVVPNRGFRVASRTARDLAELAEVRTLLELPAMLRLARTLPARTWSELLPLAETAAAVAAGGDRAGYAEADRAFHRALLGLTGNRQLVMVADELHRRAQWPTPHGPVRRTADLVADAAEHLALLDALAAQDLAGVESLMTRHVAGAVRG